MIDFYYSDAQVDALYEMAEKEPSKLIRPFSQAEVRYGQNFRAIIRELWAKRMPLAEAITRIRKLIRRGLPIAWQEGAKEAGAKKQDEFMTQSLELQQIIDNDLSHSINLAMDIERARSEQDEKDEIARLGAPVAAGGKTLDSFISRSNVWVNRFRMTAMVGLVVVGVNLFRRGLVKAPPMAQWVLGIAEHCESCVTLSGVTKPVTVWFETGILPRVPGATYLICRGYNCQCRLRKVEHPATRGKMPTPEMLLQQ